MNILAIILWSGLILLLCAAIVLALVASGKGRHWLVVPCVVFVGIAIVWSVLGGATTAPGFGFQVAAGIGLLVLGVVAGSPLVTLILELAGSGSVALGDHGGIMVTDDSPSPERREILRGGMTIGYLERLAIIGAALAGQFAAVAVVVAIKGLGRFSELENSAARERFIIGTLVSVIWAAACVAPMVLA
ncbi:MAG TPA: hypothetical protein VIQ78_09950 [Terrimesophilobacter sp.]|uniref:hypothetical protein n=1 Tax=Terrimesophilobacter sp. TaxID=2906435 RepID=UPI002F92F8A2